MKYKSELKSIYVYISEKRKDYADIKRIICHNMMGKHKVVFGSTDGYEQDKDILIGDGTAKIDYTRLELSEDIGFGKEYRGSAAYVVYNPEDITVEYCEHIYARKTNTPAFILETKNYIVREEAEGDLPKLHKLYLSLSECTYIEPLYEPEQEKIFLKNYIANMYYFFDYGLWLVFDKNTGELVGRMGIENRSIDGVNCQELGYLVGKKYQRRGIAYEVCSAILDYAREYLGIDKLYACIHKDNIASVNFIKKLGFKVYANDVEGMNIYFLFL